MPGLAKALVLATAAGDVGEEGNHGLYDSVERNDVPRIVRDDVADDEVEVGGAITPVMSAMAVELVGVVEAPAGLHLHPGDAVEGGEDQEVKKVIVAVRAADGKSQSNSFGHEGQLGPIALGLAMTQAGAHARLCTLDLFHVFSVETPVREPKKAHHRDTELTEKGKTPFIFRISNRRGWQCHAPDTYISSVCSCLRANRDCGGLDKISGDWRLATVFLHFTAEIAESAEGSPILLDRHPEGLRSRRISQTAGSHDHAGMDPPRRRVPHPSPLLA